MNGEKIEIYETQKVLRLVEYLTRIAFLKTKIIRDYSEFEKILWISDIPHEKGCFAQAWGRDEEHDPDEWIEGLLMEVGS